MKQTLITACFPLKEQPRQEEHGPHQEEQGSDQGEQGYSHRVIEESINDYLDMMNNEDFDQICKDYLIYYDHLIADL